MATFRTVPPVNYSILGPSSSGSVDERVRPIRKWPRHESIHDRRGIAVEVRVIDESMSHTTYKVSSRWESGLYHLGQFHDECFKNLTPEDRKNRCIS